ncbi:MAG: hypothetical protein ACR2PB_12890 [Desulfocapsaceae bacterium]
MIFYGKNQNDRSQNSTRNIWYLILKKTELPHEKFHITRHTFPGLLLAANVPISCLSKTMGHSRI